MNLVRTGAAAVIGGISGGLATMPGGVALPIAGLTPGYDAVAEAAGLILGGALQWFAPMTAPSVVDGLVDGSIALLVRRGVYHGLKPTGGTRYQQAAWRANGIGAASFGNVGQGSRGDVYSGNQSRVAVVG